MTAIVVFLSTPIDADKLAEYGQKALATVATHGGTAPGLGPLFGLSNGAAYTHGAIFSLPTMRPRPVGTKVPLIRR